MEKIQLTGPTTRVLAEKVASSSQSDDLATVAALGLAQLNLSSDQRQDLQQAVPQSYALSLDATPLSKEAHPATDPLMAAAIYYNAFVNRGRRVEHKPLRLPVSGGITKHRLAMRARVQGMENRTPRPGRYVFTSIGVKYEGPISSESPGAGK